MDYTQWTRDALIGRIDELTLLSTQLLREKNQETRLDYDWTGNLGHWYWNIKTNTVTFNPLKLTALGYDMPEDSTPVPYQFFTEKLHPDDYEATMTAMRNHLQGKTHVYEVEYRIQAKDGSYRWFYDRGKITKYDPEGKPLFLAGIVFDITEKKLNEENLRNENSLLAEQSTTDSLTGLKNHRTSIEHLRSARQISRYTGKPLSLAMLDLDSFKEINDTHGHLAGDAVLVEIAGIIKKTIRDSDLAGRYGGDEFILVFENAPLSTARDICERIRTGVESAALDEGISITISGGVCEYRGESITEFIEAADGNLYEAKRTGKNRIV